MRGQPGEGTSWQVVDEHDEVGKIARSECMPYSQIKLLLGNPALDKACLQDIDGAIPVRGRRSDQHEADGCQRLP